MEYKDEPQAGEDYQGVNVKQDPESLVEDSIAANGQEEHQEQQEEPRVDRNLPTAAPGEEGEYEY